MSQDGHTQHILPLKMYLSIGSILLALTVITVWVAQYDLGTINLLVAMIIAVTKATLVALFFMHLKYTNKFYSVVFVGAILMVAVFIVFTMFDTMTRGQIYEFRGHPINDKAIIYQDSPAAEPTVDSLATQSSDSSGLDTH